MNRLLLGPGPSAVHPDVLKAMATPLVGHLDPYFFEVMNGTREMLRTVFGTKNELTIPMSGTGSAGMETVFVNLIEPGDKVIVCVNGVFGERMKDVAERCGASVVEVTAPWGQPIDPDEIRKALEKNGQVKLVAIVQAETSTGVRQPLKEVSEIVHEHGALFAVDSVTALGGIPVDVDENGIDACYSGTQKCLSAPPGLSPVTMSDDAVQAIRKRKTKVQSWYLDLGMIANYWGEDRFYHHTAPISMVFALHEALRILLNEGLENVYKRHEDNGKLLQQELQSAGFELLAAEGYRLPQLTAFRLPQGLDDIRLRRELLNLYGIEVGGGLGPLKGQIWRVGLMGHSSNLANVRLFMGALQDILNRNK